MGKYQKSVWGKIKGKVGEGVGRKWRSLWVLAAYQPEVSNPNTTSQQLQRTRFRALTYLAKAFRSAVNIGFDFECRGKKQFPRAMFMSRNFENVTADTPGSASILYSELVVADGSIPEASFGAPSFTNPLEVDVSMSSTADMPDADADDEVFVFVYSTEAGAGMLNSHATKRSDNSVTVNVPAYWNGHRVHVWGFVRSANPEFVGQCSKSRYLGSGTIS